MPKQDIIRNLIGNTYFELFRTKFAADISIFGTDNAALDSMDLIRFVIALEQRLEEKLGIKVTITDIARDSETNIYQNIETLASAITNSQTTTKKLLIVDLDNTLWSGIIGDDGIDYITVTLEHKKLHQDIKDLIKQGILVAIASKNNEAFALEAFLHRPDIILDVKDFVTWRINWDSKAENIELMLKELNLGAESVVFLDDSPLEREAVTSRLPEVTAIEKLDLTLFKSSAELTEEDQNRLRMYQTEKERLELKDKMTNEEWLEQLGICVRCDPVNELNKARVLQLINKTNQMNLQTRRYAESGLNSYLMNPSFHFWTFSVTDKFGDYGLVGVVSGVTDDVNNVFRLKDFVLSCRAFDRNIEDYMLATVFKECLLKGYHKIRIEYHQTPKNKPCLSFLKRLPLNNIWETSSSMEIFELPVTGNRFEAPQHIKTVR